MSKHIIRIGADPFPPYQFINEKGEVEGIDYEKVTDIIQKAGYEAEVVIDEWSIVEAQFLSGALDALFQVQKSPEREKKFQFSSLLRNAVTEVLTADKELKLEDYKDICKKNLKLGALKGYAYGAAIDELPEASKKYYDTSSSLLQAIAEQEVPLGVFDQGVKEYLMKQMNIQKLFSVKALEFLRPLYIMYH